MAQLEDRHRHFIVTGLACFESPSRVAQAVQERFGIEVPRQQVYGYDAAAAETTGRRIAERWRELFWATRRRYLADMAGIGAANKVHRLRRLDALFRRAEKMGNLKLAAALLEQAAKEMGGVYTSRSGPESYPGGSLSRSPRSGHSPTKRHLPIDRTHCGAPNGSRQFRELCD